MTPKQQRLVEALQSVLGDRATSVVERLGEITVVVKAEAYLEAAKLLRDHESLRFGQVIDLCGVDYSTYGDRPWERERFAAVLHLNSVVHNWRIRLRVFAKDDAFPVLPSVIDVWSGVNWYEREAFDLFGIVFEGHPDLRRILTDYGFVGHPFRKDFPLIGNVEVRYDPAKGRVVYEPVAIEPRTLVPRVIRQDTRHAPPAKDAAGHG